MGNYISVKYEYTTVQTGVIIIFIGMIVITTYIGMIQTNLKHDGMDLIVIINSSDCKYDYNKGSVCSIIANYDIKGHISTKLEGIYKIGQNLSIKIGYDKKIYDYNESDAYKKITNIWIIFGFLCAPYILFNIFHMCSGAIYIAHAIEHTWGDKTSCEIRKEIKNNQSTLI